MLKSVLLGLAVVTCYANPTQKPIQCGVVPSNTFKCLNSPALINGLYNKCAREVNECGVLSCVFREVSWMEGAKVNKTKVSERFDSLISEHPSWSAAVNHMKAACLGPVDLPAQGVFINCPAYDIVHCATSIFLKEATPSQWQSSADCGAARAWAAACPYCPGDCFSPMVPIGSCNACSSLPRSP